MKKKKIPAIPPSNYRGSIGEWIAWLILYGYMENGDDHGEIMLSEDVYNQLLEDCES